MGKELSRAVIEALPEHLAVLDSAGRIIATNRAWDVFANRERGGKQPDSHRRRELPERMPARHSGS